MPIFTLHRRFYTQRLPNTLMSKHNRISASVCSSNGLVGIMPALLTRIETVPTVRFTASARSMTAERFDTSQLNIMPRMRICWPNMDLLLISYTNGYALPPSSSINRTVSWLAFSLTSTHTSTAPARAYSSAVSRPMPCPVPVIYTPHIFTSETMDKIDGYVI